MKIGPISQTQRNQTRAQIHKFDDHLHLPQRKLGLGFLNKIITGGNYSMISCAKRARELEK